MSLKFILRRLLHQDYLYQSLLLLVSAPSSCNSLGPLSEPPLPLVLHHPEPVVLLQTVLSLVTDVIAPPSERTVFPMADFGLKCNPSFTSHLHLECFGDSQHIPLGPCKVLPWA